MAITGPHYGTRIPSATTHFNALGYELMQFGLDIENLLNAFDYNGADPNLVLARTAALEAWRTVAEAQLLALDGIQNSHFQNNNTNSTRRMVTQYGIGFIVPASAASAVTKSVTFPQPFAAIPVVHVDYLGSKGSSTFDPSGLVDNAPPTLARGYTPSNTGFTAMIRRTDSAGITAGWGHYYAWSATGVLA